MLIGVGYWIFSNRPNNQIPVTQQVEQQSLALSAAIEADNVDALETLLPGAEQTLSLAERYGLSNDDVTSLRFSLVTAQDLVNGTDRLDSVGKIGTLPAEFDERPPTLLLFDGDLMVLGDTLYRVDRSNRELWVWTSASEQIGTGVGLVAASDGNTIAIASDQVVFFQQMRRGTFSQYYGQWPENLIPECDPIGLFWSTLSP